MRTIRRLILGIIFGLQGAAFADTTEIFVRLNSDPFAAPYYIFSNTENGDAITPELVRGSTYVFTRTDSGHAFNIGSGWRSADSSLGTSSTGTGGSVSGVASIESGQKLTVQIPADFSGNAITYYCYQHSSMLSTISVIAGSVDSDNDGVEDSEDAFPNDASETLDTDLDGIGNNADTDDDNDTLSDTFELSAGRNPLSPDYKIDAGWGHVCVLHDGGVECWGSNGAMQASPPVLDDAIDVCAGGYHSCALLKDGSVTCWGEYSNSRTPAGTGNKSLAVGGYHTCVIDSNDSVQCTGVNDYGQSTVPILSNPTEIVAGSHHSCAKDDTGVICWGRNNYGQTDVPTLTNPRALSTKTDHTCVQDDSGIICWGRNDSNQSENNLDLDNVRSFAAGAWLNCALTDSGVSCWTSGWGDKPPTLTNPKQITGGSSFFCALDDDGVECWGDPSIEAITKPVPTGLSFGDEDLDGVKDDVDAVTTKVSFDEQTFTVEIKAKQEADNPVDWIDFRLGPKGSSCFIEKRVTKEGSDDADFYVGKALWSIGENYSSGQFGVISDTPRIKLQDGTETYDQSEYFVDLDNTGGILPTYSLVSSTLTKSGDSTVISELVVSGFGEDGFLSAFPGSTSDAYKSSIHLKDGASYVGVTLDPSKVEKISDDTYKLTTTHIISNDEDFTNPRIQSISICDGSMNGQVWNTDNDQDGIIDGIDAFPLDASETLDTDLDSVGNNADLDDDGDGFSDAQEAIDGTDPLSKFSCATGCFSFDIDNSTSLAALTDGLLVIRHLFGFTGDTLIASATDTSAIRNSAADISAYLTAAESELDIDGSGDVTALTDGLLLIRYLFGFSGDSLISGAVGTSATRTTSAEIEDYIKARVPSS